MTLNRRQYLATLGTATGALALAGCSESESGDISGGNANGNSGDSASGDAGNGGGDSGSGNDQPDVEILEDLFYEEEFSAGVRGTAVNNTDSELSYVEATATFLDEEGTQIGEGLDNVNGLVAGRK
jgi:hypothetical protein